MKKALFAVMLYVVAGCSQADNPDRAREVADAYLKTEAMVEPEGRVSVKDEGGSWVVVYHGHQDWAGGERFVQVDKKTMKVTGTVAHQ